MGTSSLNEQVLQLLEDQKREWELAGNNYQGLKKIEVKDMQVDDAAIRLQFNPERIYSSAAKVDPKSIQERKCFLCKAHLPAVQRGISYKEDKYTILVNPFPIFHKHLTVPMSEHTDQLMFGDRICDMLDLAKDIPSFTIFYNGPKSGASAPDHFHFQAAEAGVMPVEDEYASARRKKLGESEGVLIETIDNYLRKVIILTSSERDGICRIFNRLVKQLDRIEKQDPEPMINVIVRFMEGKWYLFLFPRRAHRPSQFFAEGDDQIVFSPASVDFGGLLIFPRREDFEKMTPEIIEDMFSQVTYSDDKWAEMVAFITSELN